MVEWSITTVLKTVVLRGTGGSNPSLSANKRHQFFLMPFFVAVANRVLTVLSVASLGESAPLGRARIPLSPQKEQPHGLLFFAYANRVLTVLSVASL